jgi:two-component system response regulator FixJ
MSTVQLEQTVYVIDDDEAVRQSLEFLLKTAGIAVLGFESAKAFLEKLPHIKSGCIITDVRMPEITGIDLLHRVRDSNVDIPVIVITGHGDVSLAVEAMKIGAVDFLEKPFDDELLLSSARTKRGIMPRFPKLTTDWRHCRTASAKCLMGWWPVKRTR